MLSQVPSNGPSNGQRVYKTPRLSVMVEGTSAVEHIATIYYLGPTLLGIWDIVTSPLP